MSNLKNKNISTARLIATILVIFGHAISPFAEDIYIRFELKSNFLLYLHNYIYSFHMPLFFIISGMVFYLAAIKKMESEKESKFIYKKFLRLIVPLIFIKFLVLTPVKYVIDLYDIGYNFKTIVRHYAHNTDVGHLWYLFVLFVTECIFFVVIKKIDIMFSKWFLQLSVMVLLFIISIYSNNLPYLGKLMLKNCYTYPIFLFIGILIEKYKIKLKKYITLNTGIVLFIIHLYLWSVTRNMEIIPITLYRFLGIIGSTYVLCLSCYINSISDTKFGIVIEENSMGIYLFHLPLQYLILYVLTKFCHNSFAVTVAVLMGSLVGSIFIAKFIRATRLDFLIGEKYVKKVVE